MDYEQKYKKALERAKCLIQNEETNVPVFYVSNIEEIFPELKESEDEKIRKWIINEIKIKHHHLDEEDVDFVDKAIAWLEKQKLTLSKGDKEYLDSAFRACLHHYGKDSDTAEWLNSLVEQL